MGFERFRAPDIIWLFGNPFQQHSPHTSHISQHRSGGARISSRSVPPKNQHGTDTVSCTFSHMHQDKDSIYNDLQIVSKDLKSFSRQRECGFESRPGHHHCKGVIGFFGPGFFSSSAVGMPERTPHPGRVPFHLRRGVGGLGRSRCSSGRDRPGLLTGNRSAFAR